MKDKFTLSELEKAREQLRKIYNSDCEEDNDDVEYTLEVVY